MGLGRLVGVVQGSCWVVGEGEFIGISAAGNSPDLWLMAFSEWHIMNSFSCRHTLHL